MERRKDDVDSRYYATGSERASRVQELFSTVASRYDLINDVQSFLLHRAWKRRLLRLAAPAAGERALDICCGTGDVTFGLAAAGADSVGLDFCRPMLRVALQRATQGAPGRCVFVQGDAQWLPFPDQTFDIVTISYGLRNLADWQRGAGEMLRMLRRRGRLVILDFARPGNRFWRAVYLSYLRLALPCFGAILCGDAQAYAYILESLNHYPDPEIISRGLVEAGAESVKVIPLLGGIMTLHLARRG